MMLCTIDDIRNRALPILLDDAEDLRRVVLFGSYARGEQTEKSDLDLYVDGRLRYNMSDTKDTAEKISEALSVPVDLITRSALAGSVLRDKMQDSIECDGIVLYG
ncbi:MAG: nucleotidyltransferase domain-containing protein [Coriobacteriales bacterium]|jgi:predicted nucleotidyltransferase|nr:nucleotidyltransferase domain-containing protein [Coriobacteriales bacterium]